MKKILLVAALLLPITANAAKTCILVGDSIMSDVSTSVIGGTSGHANQLAASLIQSERNVIIRNISSPGASLAAKNFTGFGNVNQTINMIGGLFSYYNCIIIQAGTNDFGRSEKWEDMVVSLRAVLSNARNMKKRVIMTDLVYRANERTLNKLGYNIDTYRWFRAIVCNEYADVCTFVNREGTVFAKLDKSLYDANEAAKGTELHLNAKGHRAYADWLMKAAATAKIF